LMKADVQIAAFENQTSSVRYTLESGRWRDRLLNDR